MVCSICHDAVVIPAEKSINEHLFFTSETLDFKGTIKGDLVGACRDAKLSE